MNTTVDLLKYVDRGERILSRLNPRDYNTKREERRLFANWKQLAQWADDLPGDWNAVLRYDGEPEVGDVPAQWAHLACGIKTQTDRALFHRDHGRADRVAFHLSEARHHIRRMRVLAVRGESYSPLLTRDELAADLRANGINMEGTR